MRIDAHHHLWRYTPDDYGWIDAPLQSLRRDFLPAELALEAAAASVTATVAVQARQSLDETRWLLDLAAKSSLISAVVGWAPVAAPDLPDILGPLLANPLLRGLRHVVQAELPGFLDDPAFNRGITALAPTGLTYDLLIVAGQLPEAIRFVDRHPDQIFILDHIAKPNIAANALQPWAEDIRDIAQRPNVTCKLSGMVTEADHRHWTAAQLHTYFETVLEAFTPARLMIGTDWPVLTVACTYSQWWQTVSTWLAPLSPTERSLIEYANAARTYNMELTLPALPPLQPRPHPTTP